MGYIDKVYYLSKYGGDVIDEQEMDRLIEQASSLIDEITGYKIVSAGGVDALLAEAQPHLRVFIKNQIEKATAAQVEYLDINGGTSVANGGAYTASSVSFGSYSESVSGGQAKSLDARVSPLAISLLMPTGLLYTGGI